MAVTASILRPSLSGSVTGKSRLTAKRGYSAVWQITAGQEDGPGVIIDYFKGSGDHPYIGDRYNLGGYRDNSVRCVSITPRRIETGVGQWLVAVEWEPPEGADDEPEQGTDADGNKTDDPLLWHDEIAATYTQVSVPVELATFRGANIDGRNGQPLPRLNLGAISIPCNSALVPFDPGIEMELDVKVITFGRNLEEYDGDLYDQYIGKVNSDQVQIRKPAPYSFKNTWGPLTARIKNISGTFQITNKIPYWKVTTEVHVTPLGWRRLLVDMGAARRLEAGTQRGDGSTVSNSDADVGQLEQEQDANGYPLKDVLFDGKGAPLEEGKPPVYLEWQLYEEIKFAGLNW